MYGLRNIFTDDNLNLRGASASYKKILSLIKYCNFLFFFLQLLNFGGAYIQGRREADDVTAGRRQTRGNVNTRYCRQNKRFTISKKSKGSVKYMIYHLKSITGQVRKWVVVFQHLCFKAAKVSLIYFSTIRLIFIFFNVP